MFKCVKRLREVFLIFQIACFSETMTKYKISDKSLQNYVHKGGAETTCYVSNIFCLRHNYSNSLLTLNKKSQILFFNSAMQPCQLDM